MEQVRDEQGRKNFGRAVWEDPNSRSGRKAGVLTPASLPRREPTPPRAAGPSEDAASGWTSPLRRIRRALAAGRVPCKPPQTCCWAQRGDVLKRGDTG